MSYTQTLKSAAHATFWEAHQKYITIALVVMALLATAAYVFISPFAGSVVIAVGSGLILFSIMFANFYYDCKNDDDIDAVVQTALLATLITLVIALVGAFLFLVIIGFLSSVVGFSLFLPAMFVLIGLVFLNSIV